VRGDKKPSKTSLEGSRSDEGKCDFIDQYIFLELFAANRGKPGDVLRVLEDYRKRKSEYDQALFWWQRWFSKSAG
jgi:hypothetical protein